MEAKIDIGVTDEQIQAIVREATLQALNEKTREKLISGAIEQLLQKEKRGYNYLTPLQEAFNSAIREVANEEAKKHLTENAEVMSKIRELIASGFEKAVAEKNVVVKAIADGIISAFECHKD